MAPEVFIRQGVGIEMRSLSILNRRKFLVGSASLTGLALTGCSSVSLRPEKPVTLVGNKSFALMYGPLDDEKFPIPGVNFVCDLTLSLIQILHHLASISFYYLLG